MNAPWSVSDTFRLYGKAAAALGPIGALQWRAARHADSMIATPLSEHPLLARGATSDRDVFYQIFVDREYRCIDHLTDVKIIVDAGANVGYSSAYLLSRFPEARVIALEPDSENFETLQRNLAPWGDRVTCLKMALWSKRDTLDFRADTVGPGAEWGRQVEASGAGDVEAIDVPGLMETYGLPRIDLLKVDIEGAEREVFREPSWLPGVRNMVVEIHGPEEDHIFRSAIKGREYSISQCEELTVCLS